MSHVPVLLEPVLEHLVPLEKLPTRVIDGTLGAGGHTGAMIARGVGHVLGLDVDPQAIAIATQNLASVSDKVTIVQASYETMIDHLATLQWQDGVDAILLDLGVSSMQFDTPERGFSFRYDAPLDMRFVADGRLTAADIINSWSGEDLAHIFYRYGEEDNSRIFAKAILAKRPLHTTQQLSAVLEQVMPKFKGKPVKSIHPATKVFQALRIAVNDELARVENGLQAGIKALRSGGRFGVISFHSLEDRIVKDLFKEWSTEIVSPPGMASIQAKPALGDLLTKKPIEATPTEASANPRARSAKFRVIQKR
jgi:16S rRNA (cytosine1402-N4)-methyltransferase